MSSALYNAMSAALAQSRALDNTAHNVANASTPGFRAQRTTFEEVLGDASPQVRVSEVRPDDSKGQIRSTGQPLDLALPGDGYFALGTENGPRFTRDGSFRVSADGYLVNRDGLPVLGKGGGGIQVPPHAKAVSVSADGVVEADGEHLGEVAVVAVGSRDLVAEGSTLRALPEARIQELEQPVIESGALEGSNFDAVRGMLDLIRASRAYEASTRSMQTISDLEKRAARGFGNG